MNKKLLLLFALLGLVSLQGKSANPKDYVWFGEKPYYAEGSYTPEFYIYNIGTGTFLTNQNTAVLPGTTITPTLFTLVPDGENWIVKSTLGSSDVYLKLDNNTASCNATDQLAVTLSPTKCVNSNALGQAFQLKTTQKYRNWGIVELVAPAYFYFFLNDNLDFVSSREGTWEDDVSLWIYDTKTDYAKYLLISKEQYETELIRKRKAMSMSFIPNRDFTAFLLNPTIIQSQGTGKYMPWGWYENEERHVSNDGRVTFLNGASENGDTYLQNWHNQATFDVDYYQNVVLPKGKYAFSGELAFTGEKNTVALYAAIEGVGDKDTAYINVVGEDMNRYSVEFSIPVETSLYLGVKKIGDFTDGDVVRFLKADNFKLTYLGSAEPTQSEDYWFGEQPVKDNSAEYYIFNLGAEMYIGYEKSVLVDSVNAKLFTVSNDEHPEMTSGDYVVSMNYSLTKYHAHIHRNGTKNSWGTPWCGDNAGATIAHLNNETNFTFSEPYEDGSFTMETYGFNSVINAERYFGVEYGGTAYEQKTTPDYYARWKFISQHQMDSYYKYLDTYEKGLDYLEKEMPTSYREDLEEGLNMPAQYDPSIGKDNATNALEIIIDKIDSLYITDDRTTGELRFGTVCRPYTFHALVDQSDDATDIVKLYQVDRVEGKTVYLTPVEPENTVGGHGYIYLSNLANPKFQYLRGEIEERTYSDGFLTGTLPATTKYPDNDLYPKDSYILKTKNGEQNFYHVASDTHGVAYRAYLQLPAVTAEVSMLGFCIEEPDVDVIDETFFREDKPAVIYDLNGRRLSTLQRGVNIVNGHKVIVK